MADSADAAAGSLGSPSDFLRTVVGQKVTVKLNSGVSYQGQSCASSMYTEKESKLMRA